MNTPKISLEFTSPSNPIAEKSIIDACDSISTYQTDFSIVNFGGDKMSPERSVMICDRLQDEYDMMSIGYLRRLHIDKQKFKDLLKIYKAKGIKKIFLTEGRRLNLAPVAHDHYPSLRKCIEIIQNEGDFQIHLEARPETNSSEVDFIASLIDLDIHEIVTLFSFNSDTTLRFLDKLSSKVQIPSVRIGVMPIENPSKTFLTAYRLNVNVPENIQRLFSVNHEMDNIHQMLGVHIFLMQIQDYMNAGLQKFHIRFGKYSVPIIALCEYFDIPLKKRMIAEKVNAL